MGFFDETSEKRAIFPIIFIVDASDGMAGARMSDINEALEIIVDKLREANNAGEGPIEYAVLRVADEAQWVTDGLTVPGEMSAPIIKAGGRFKLGSTLAELERWLSNGAFSDAAKKYGSPSFCFIADTLPADDYLPQLEKLNKSNLYICSFKYALILGDSEVYKDMWRVCDDPVHVWKKLSNERIEDPILRLFSNFFSSLKPVEVGGEDFKAFENGCFDLTEADRMELNDDIDVIPTEE